MTLDEIKAKIQEWADESSREHDKYGDVGFHMEAQAFEKVLELLESLDAPPIDYRGLLRKYMDHVEECEGVHFIYDVCRYDGDGELLDYVELTEDEWAELVRISKDV